MQEKNMSRIIKFPAIEDFEKKNKIEIRELTIQHGLSFPSNEELIMLILGSGTKRTPIKDLSRQVLEIVMSSNCENLVENLLRINGMGKSKALIIAAALELGRRIGKNPEAVLNNPSDIIPYVQSYAMQKQEHFLCVMLNGAMDILSIRVICIGAGNMAIIRPRDVFAEALKEHASAIVLCHNHPGGNPNPSQQDIKTTLRLYQAAELLGISILDHIIIAKTGYYSFLEHNLMDEEKMFSLTD